MRTPRSADRACHCLEWRKDGRSQRGALANNPPANAGDAELAVHGGAQWSRRALPSRAAARVEDSRHCTNPRIDASREAWEHPASTWVTNADSPGPDAARVRPHG